MKRKGLTLLELILAMTMLSIFVLASTSLNFFALRAANFNAEETRLQNQLEYVLQDMQKYLPKSRRPLATEGQIWQSLPTGEMLTVTDENDPSITADNVLISYSFVGTSIDRCMGSSCATLSQGYLMKKPGSNQVFEIVPNSDDKLIRVNLAAQTTKKYGSVEKTVSVNGASRLFFLRGAEPT